MQKQGTDAPYFVDMERWMEETVEFMDHYR